MPASLRAAQAGTPHGAEVPYTMGTGQDCACLAVPWDDADRAVSRRMVDEWVAFAAVGTPSSSDAPAWPQDASRDPQVMEFGERAVVRPAFMARRLDVFIGTMNVLDRFSR